MIKEFLENILEKIKNSYILQHILILIVILTITVIAVFFTNLEAEKAYNNNICPTCSRIIL